MVVVRVVPNVDGLLIVVVAVNAGLTAPLYIEKVLFAEVPNDGAVLISTGKCTYILEEVVVAFIPAPNIVYVPSTAVLLI